MIRIIFVLEDSLAAVWCSCCDFFFFWVNIFCWIASLIDDSTNVEFDDDDDDEKNNTKRSMKIL